MCARAWPQLLVQRKRIDIVHSGFVQHDEALTSLTGALTQLTFGSRWLSTVLDGVDFKVGYHIDPVERRRWDDAMTTRFTIA